MLPQKNAFPKPRKSIFNPERNFYQSCELLAFQNSRFCNALYNFLQLHLPCFETTFVLYAVVKAAFQLSVFHTCVYARKSLNLSKFYTSTNYLNKCIINYTEN